MYQNVLGRAPDASGREHWVDGLSSGRNSRGGVMIGFSESNEYVVKTKTTPPKPGRSFGDGVHTGFDDIIANEFADGQVMVTISATDQAFSSSDCGFWTKVG